MNYLGIGLGFIRIVVVPLIVMHRDNEMFAESGFTEKNAIR